jgi:transcriptional regulator with XRE-family HTH domain
MQRESIKATRTMNGLSREQFARSIGVSRSLVSYLEQGRRIITDETKRKIHLAYDAEYIAKVREFTEQSNYFKGAMLNE